MSNAPKWSIEELEYLYEIASSDAFYILVGKFHNKAHAEGWAHRSENAIKVKLSKLKIGIKPMDGGWNCSGLAAILEVNRDRVHDWIERGLLKTSRKSGKRHHRIKHENFIAFAKAYPHWLTAINEANLRNLLPDSVVDKIIEQPIRTRGVSTPVRTNKGVTYTSMRAAARNEYYTKNHIKKLAQTGARTRTGIAFQFVEAI